MEHGPTATALIPHTSNRRVQQRVYIVLDPEVGVGVRVPRRCEQVVPRPQDSLCRRGGCVKNVW